MSAAGGSTAAPPRRGLRCPRCGREALSLWCKLRLAPLGKLTCAGCGAALRPRRLPGVALAILGSLLGVFGGVLLIVAVGAFASMWNLFGTFLAGMLAVELLAHALYVFRVTLVASEDRTTLGSRGGRRRRR